MTLQFNPIYWSIVYLVADDPILSPVKIAQACACAVAFVTSVIVIISVQTRLYKAFECLQFRWTTFLVAPVTASLYLMAVPYYIMWTYLKHGLLNRPVVHRAVEGHVKEPC